MNYKEFYEKLESGEIVLPVEIQITSPIWDEFELDKNCKAKIVAFIDKYDDNEDNCFEITFDYSDYVEFNKNFWKPDWNLQSGGRGMFCETNYFAKQNGKCVCYVDAKDDIHFVFTDEDEKIVVSKKEYLLYKDFYEKNKNNFFVANIS